MQQDKINQLNAAKTTVSYCETTAAETASNTNFAPKVSAIKSKIVVVEGFIQLSGTPIKGVTLNVKAIRASAIENVLPLASAVFSYGSSLTPPDQDLMDQAKTSKSDLERASKEICATECQRLVALAQANAANILPFGITALMLTDADTVVTLFMSAINDPRAAVITRKNAGDLAEVQLASLMNTNLTLQLDPMADIFRFSKNEWWRGYRLSREIIDLGKTFTKLRATVKDVNNVPVKGAVVSLSQNGTVVYSKKTDAEGKVSIVKIKPGNYDLKAEKTGLPVYNEADVHFAPGSEKIHPIVLGAGGGGGNTIVRSGSLGISIRTTINTDDIHSTPETTITILITGGSADIYGSDVANGLPGAQVIHAQDGVAITLTAAQFQAQTGLSDTRPFLVIQNTSPVNIQYTFTFAHVE